MKPILLIITLLVSSLSLQAQDLKLGLPVGHTDKVNSIVFSSDGKLILSSSDDKTARLWDHESGKLIRTFTGHISGVNTALFSPDNKRILTSDNNFTFIWDLESGQILDSLINIEELIISEEKTVTNIERLIDVERSITWDQEPFALDSLISDRGLSLISSQFNSDGTRVITQNKNQVKLWNASNGEFIHSFNNSDRAKSQYEHKDKNQILSACFSPDGTEILVGCRGVIRLFNAKSGELISKMKYKPGKGTIPGHSFFNSKGTKIYINYKANRKSDDIINVWDKSSGKLLEELNFEFKYLCDLNSLFLSTDENHFIATTQDLGYRDTDIGNGVKRVVVLDRRKGTVSGYRKFKGYSNVCMSPRGSLMLAYGKDNVIKFVDYKSGYHVTSHLFNNSNLSAVSYSPDGNYVAFASFDSTSVDFDIDGIRYLDNSISIFNLNTGEVVHKINNRSNYVNSAKFNKGNSSILTVSNDSIARIWDSNTGKLTWQTHKSKDFWTQTGTFSPDGQNILFTKFNNGNGLLNSNIKKYGGGHVYALNGDHLFSLSVNNGGVYDGIYSPDGSIILTKNKDNAIRLFDAKNGNLLHKLQHDEPSHLVVFGPDSKILITISGHEGNEYRIWDVMEGVMNIGLYRSPNNISIHPKHKYWIESAKDQIFYSFPEGGAVKGSGIQLKDYYGTLNGAFSQDGRFYIATYQDGIITFFQDSSNYKPLSEAIKYSINKDLAGGTTFLEMPNLKVDDFILNPNGKDLLTLHESNNAFVIDIESGQKLREIDLHTSSAKDVQFNKDGTILLTAIDGVVELWDVNTGGRNLQHFFFDNDPKKWVHLHPSGLFDASQEAMDMMYWTKGLEVIEFSQLKDRYWLPGLWEKVMSGKALPRVQNMQELKLYPEVSVNTIDENTLSIDLTKRDGGYGAVKVLLNGKEINQDARGANFDPSKNQQTLKIDITDHPYLKEGENKITVIASSENGINSRGVDNIIKIKKKEQKQAQFFAVVVGINEYANDNINLKFPVADAKAISKAVSLGAQNLFQDRSYVYTLTSDGDKRPSKDNLNAVFEDIAKKASSEDIILLYLAGHGISTSGDQGDFYFLTADAMSANQEAYDDEQIRNSTTISTNEWVEWLKKIPALKQVMILDACGSGKAVDNLVAERDIEPSQRKAMDRMKDRTGMYIISGCAADAVSYEASQYGQGLLTYALLQGMKGAALKEDQYVDVATILHHAIESVPQLAKGIGGIQEPQLLQPKSGSFDIGILNDLDRKAIPLANPKTVYVRSSFVDSEEFEDILNLSEQLDKRLSQISSRGADADLVFFDARKFPNACKLSGGYQKSNDKISLSLKIRCGEDLKEHQIEAESKEELIDKIIQTLNLE